MKKTILITGASQGIGSAIAEMLANDGYSLHLCGRNEKALASLADRLSPKTDTAFHVFDLSDSEEVKNFTAKWNGEIYGLINNAGICKVERIDETEEVWGEVISTNLSGPYFLTKGLQGHMSNNGRIVNISSQLGKEGRAGYGAYCASKFALIGLTKCWAKELGTRGITVNAVCPGWVSTEMSTIDLRRLAEESGQSPEEYYKMICEPLELKRFTTPEEVAALVAFLISERASGITGRDMLMNTIWNQE